MAKAELNPLALPDEDINDAILEQMAGEVEEDSPAEVETEADPVESDETDDGPGSTEDEDDSDDESSEDDDDDSTEETASTESKVSTSKEEVSEEDEETTESTKATEIDYKAEREAIFAPFKANGKTMQIESVDDARNLMQMGANYNKKMAALKPNLRMLKMLESNGLLDENKLSFLIDIDKKNPDAIKKLIQDSKIDLVELDDSVPAGYKPNKYTVSDAEIELDTVLASIQGSEGFDKTLDVIGNQWDDRSKSIIADNPALIPTINSHIVDGTFDKVMSVVERERMFGRLNGLSDIEAYKQVGEQINSKGGFASQNEQEQILTNGISSKNNVNRVKKTVDPKLIERKKAASPTKSVSQKVANAEFNPLSMSDEAFEKLNNKYI